MPGRTADQARKAFLAPLRQAFACITPVPLFVAGKNAGEVEALTAGFSPTLPLESRRVGRIQFELGHQFKLVEEDDGEWHVSTVRYMYQLLDASDNELIAWHWHPQTGNAYAHAHVPAAPINRRMHVPTGRVSIEAVLRFLMTELEVEPRREDFAQVLRESESLFIRHRRWHSYRPQP